MWSRSVVIVSQGTRHHIFQGVSFLPSIWVGSFAILMWKPIEGCGVNGKQEMRLSNFDTSSPPCVGIPDFGSGTMVSLDECWEKWGRMLVEMPRPFFISPLHPFSLIYFFCTIANGVQWIQRDSNSSFSEQRFLIDGFSHTVIVSVICSTQWVNEWWNFWTCWRMYFYCFWQPQLVKFLDFIFVCWGSRLYGPEKIIGISMHTCIQERRRHSKCAECPKERSPHLCDSREDLPKVCCIWLDHYSWMKHSDGSPTRIVLLGLFIFDIRCNCDGFWIFFPIWWRNSHVHSLRYVRHLNKNCS